MKGIRLFFVFFFFFSSRRRHTRCGRDWSSDVALPICIFADGNHGLEVFLIGYGGDFKPMITIGEYTDLSMTIVLGLAIIFELPIVIGFAAMMGVVRSEERRVGIEGR